MLHVHLIFSTKHRERLISNTVRDALHAYMATVLQNLGCAPVLINSVEDHVHVLFELARTVSVSEAMKVEVLCRRLVARRSGGSQQRA